mmetsp:Transcript_3891/g.7819  ORF Transcript_3891/g.7819 Transcript_3891/m.7819 type:complete len:442 (-) Transcript_3891:67-1392(-)|eukprot:CAMPEP_0172660294 /NCGR_PEP_ID=MMETSP1074-20121228/3987_1 /TAXON_ID=2916 /ORGANISM="Ceratium fusus, Strain PA161109" /LENGTH=441 /DNA_ID=CAMNT_0013475901 /DNA_START=86 /DNA_END=1411 /DNA_ORIENTATION=-
MNEPLVCWASLVVVIIWGISTGGEKAQTKLNEKLGVWKVFVQWYTVTGFLLLLFFLRTMWDVIRFEYFLDHFLSPSTYKNHLNPNITGIGLTEDEMNGIPPSFAALTIPEWLRWISLASPVAGLLTFGVTGFQFVTYALRHRAAMEDHSNKFLRMVVVGMPLVFVAMSLRATIREWAVMTGSCWTGVITEQMKDASLEDRQAKWTDLKALEIATYEQDLQVASAFQFFAVGCFAQVCSKALKNMMNNNQTPDSGEERDRQIMLQLGVLGLHAFVVLGLVKTVVNIVLAMISSDPKNEALLEPIQQKILKTLDPVFFFATVLSVINMLLLGKMKKVDQVLPKANMKFNATRALLLIGQGQFTFLRALITTSSSSPVLHAVNNFKFHGEKPFEDLHWNFGIHQARLLHSSLLCFECFVVAILNCIVWSERAEKQEPLNEALLA